jgi:ATP-dependent helicase/nuclease subunit B
MNVAEEMTAKAHPDKEVVPAALLYYHVSDPMVKEEKELSPEEINERLLKELRMNGIVSSGEGIVSLLDKNFTDKSSVIPVEKKKDGSYSARSSLIAQEDYKVVSRFVSHKIRQFGREILDGKIEINPCEQSGKISCTYCAYKGICEFESRVPGYDMRILESPSEDQVLLMMREEI